MTFQQRDKTFLALQNFCVIAHELGLAGAGETIVEQEKFCLSVEMSSV